MLNRAQALGKILQNKFKCGDKIIILFPQGVDCIYGMLACFYSNVTAVPISITDSSQKEQIEEKVGPVLEDSKTVCILTDTVFKKYITENKIFSSLDVIDINAISCESKNLSEEQNSQLNNIPLILYTSGSTSKPKGILISQKSLISQAMQGSKQWHITESSIVVSWMPQFHNFGFNFNFMSPLLKGAHSIILSPDNFLEDPLFWLQCIHNYKATHTGAPNFAFDYCVNTIELPLKQTLSLNSLNAIICGGEPIRKETYDSFYLKFKELGLKENIFCSHYGMSEVGSITTNKPGTPIRFLALDIPHLQNRTIKYTNDSKKSKFIASCGEIGEDISVVSIDPDSLKPVSAGSIGEIWVKSPSVASGYLNRHEITNEIFSGNIVTTGGTGYLKTGDLGFVDDNHLYIAGREKEVIIIHGKNHYPVDIEWTIQKNLFYIKLPLAVFSCEVNEREKIIVTMESGQLASDEYAKLIQDILICVSEAHGLEVYDILFVGKKSIPKSGSGKIQRNLCRRKYLGDKLNILYSHRQAKQSDNVGVDEKKEEIEGAILEKLKKDVVSYVLKIDGRKLDNISTISELGLDSIRYVRLSKRIEDLFNIEFAPAILFKCRTFSQLSKYIDNVVNNDEKNENIVSVSADSEKKENDNARDGKNKKDIAIIGIGCNFPGASTVNEFWNNLKENKNTISPIKQSRPSILKDLELYYEKQDVAPKWGGFIDDADSFDAQFFGISPLEAESMDPQQRKLLELTWAVIEDSGYNPAEFSGKNLGLFVGVHNSDYAEMVAKRPGLMQRYGAHLDSGLHISMVSNRVSRWFDFHGHSEVINTACSSSLVAL